MFVRENPPSSVDGHNGLYLTRGVRPLHMNPENILSHSVSCFKGISMGIHLKRNSDRGKIFICLFDDVGPMVIRLASNLFYKYYINLLKF